MKYKGSCHCGKVSFEVEGEIKGAVACNCSMCQRKGSLLWFVPREDLHLLSQGDLANAYTFNKHIIKHRFCPACGVHPYAEAVDQNGKATAAINIRCIANIDLASIPIEHFDGRSI